jgi:hypothetical protein
LEFGAHKLNELRVKLRHYLTLRRVHAAWYLHIELDTASIGHGVEDTAKGVGQTVVEGAKLTGDRLQEAGQAVQPHAENAWDKVKDGAVAAGTGVKNFFSRLVGK